MTKFFAVSFFCIFVCAGCTDKPSSREYEKSFSRTVLTHAAFAVLTEHPSATNVLLCGEKIFKMAPYFKSAGVNAATNAAAGALFDAVIVDSDAKDSVKALSHLAEGGLFSVLLDVEKTTMSALRAEIVAFPMGGDASHLWMFGEYDWMMTGRKEKVKSPLDGVFEIFGSESAFPDLAAVRIESAADIFASYCGPLVQIYGGFDTGGLDAPARPEFFLTKEVQNIDWLDDGGIDADVAAGFYRSEEHTSELQSL